MFGSNILSLESQLQPKRLNSSNISESTTRPSKTPYPPQSEKSELDKEFENKLMDLQRQFKSIQQFVYSLENSMSDTKTKIGSEKQQMVQKMRDKAGLKIQINQLVELLPEFVEPIQQSADELMARCNKYREGHILKL